MRPFPRSVAPGRCRHCCVLLLAGLGGFLSLLAAARAGQSAAALGAQGGDLALTLHRAVELALAKNFTLRAAALEPKIADARLRAARGRAFDPVLSARAQRNVNNNPQLADPGLGLQANATQITSDFYAVNLTARTALGTSLSLSTNTQNRTGEFNRGRDEYNTFAGLTLTQPLLRGFGPAAALEPIRVARLDRALSGFVFRQTVTDTITEAVQAYADVLFARESEGVAARSRDLAARLLADNQRRVALGVFTDLDISVARSGLATREGAVIAASQATREAENALKLRVTDDLAGLLGIRLRLAPLPEVPAEPELPLLADLRGAFSRRPDYQQALLDLQRRQVSLRFDQNNSAPQLDLLASLGANGLDRDLGRSLAQTGRAENLAYSIGFAFSVPLPNREGRATLEASRLGIAEALLNLKKLEQSIIVLLDNAAGAVRNGRARVRVAAQGLTLARESLAAEEQKLTVGTSTIYVVLQLQNELANAENTRLRALTDYRKALADYDRQAGRTLERHGVELLP